MDGASKQLLSCTAFPGNQYGRWALRNSAGSSLGFSHHETVSDDFLKGGGGVCVQQSVGDAEQAFIGIKGFYRTQKPAFFLNQRNVRDQVYRRAFCIMVFHAVLIDRPLTLQSS